MENISLKTRILLMFFIPRPKPPSSGAFKVSPASNLHTYGQLGIKNPHYYSSELQSPTTETYGPNDFIVETVKLDSNFFNQFFTSKPLLIGRDVVTSKSVNVNQSLQKLPRKRSRKTSADLPDSLVDFRQSLTKLVNNQPSKLQQMARQHVENKAPEVIQKNPKLSQETTTSVPEPKTWTTTTKSTTNPTTTTAATTKRPTKKQKIISDVPKIINSVKTFTRYYIPPEVKISHAVTTE